MAKPTADVHLSQTKSDVWQKASIAASIFSSVVVAAMGLLVSYRVQNTQIASSEALARAQIEATKAKNADDTRLQQAKIASDMLQELIKSEAKHRAAVLVMIQPYLSAERYGQLCAALAQEDTEEKVRNIALKQLGKTPNRKGLESLKSIATDPATAPKERELAQRNAALVQAAVDRAQLLRTLDNISTKLRLNLNLEGCAKNQVCHGGEKMDIRVDNQSSVPLYLIILDIDINDRVNIISGDNPHQVLGPGEGFTSPVEISEPYGADVIRAIGSAQPIDAALLLTGKGKPFEDIDWCTQARHIVSMARQEQ